MPCDPNVLRDVPLFALLDEDELAVLAGQVEVRNFAPRQRLYRAGEPGNLAYVMVSGAVDVTTVDEDGQEVVVDQPAGGDVIGFASKLDRTPHQTSATATQTTICVEVDPHDISVLLERKPMAGMDLMAVLARQFHASQHLICLRSSRNPNRVIEERATFGEHVADAVARFGGSWSFIITFMLILSAYTIVNVLLRGAAWDPYPFILLNLFLSMLAAVQAPIIMMSQNRQDKKDRLRSELDFDVNCRAESEIQNLSRKLNALAEKVDDIDEKLR